MQFTIPVAAILIALPSSVCAAEPPEVAVDHDNIVVRDSCRLAPALKPIPDADGNGVIRIEGRADGARITVDLGGSLLFGAPGEPDACAGYGVVVTGRNVTVRNGSIKGYKIAIKAEDCDGLVIEDFDTSNNYAQRLGSAAWAEDAADWLFPHDNDQGQWIAQHGAGIAVRNASGATIRRVTSHTTQNGIVLDRVSKSEIYDNDCSFLSGWGIAMWRSSGNTICRNSLDFCVRGYSHGVYNRGQDSAGLLMFEQCCDNVVALNSATHCGDGIFGFAGREALGERPAKDAKPDWYKGRGSNNNKFIGNDLSDSAAHGLEMTFSHGNLIARNRFNMNAICGIWGGYARETAIVGNSFSGNGGFGYGAERGGVNIEHAQRTTVAGNTFARDAIGVRVWTDEDAGLAKLPWAAANGMGAKDNRITGNTFSDCDAAVELIEAKGTTLGSNTFARCKSEVVEKDCAGTTAAATAPAAVPSDADIDAILSKLPGTRQAVDGRPGLKGRDKIVMESHAPYGWDRPLLIQTTKSQWTTIYKALGFGEITSAMVLGNAPLFAGRDDGSNEVAITSNQHGFVAPYVVQLIGPNRTKIRARGVFVAGDWNLKFVPLDSPVKKLAEVPDRSEIADIAKSEKRELNFREIDFDFQGRAPKDAVPSPDAKLLDLSADRFAITGSTTLRFTPGKYRLLVESDDGIHITVDGQDAIHRWDIHGPTVDRYEFEVKEMREIPFTLEYFQNSGSARLRVWFEVIDAKVMG